jgi:pyruvate formate lyase activating enzyme
VDRRSFLQRASLGTCGVLTAGIGGALGSEPGRFAREARYYEKLPGGRVRCMLCPRNCVVGEGERGYCRVRRNLEGTYYTLVYGRVCAYHIDPIGKKPFFHFLPGTDALSLATVGCNMACKFCQNWEISQEKPENVHAYAMYPENIVTAAVEHHTPTIAYTYTEPTVYFELMHDTAEEARRRGIASVMVSAGYTNREPLIALTEVLDGIKVDLKAFNDSFYRDVCGSRLQPVLDTIKRVRESGTWLEIVNLIIPTLNDDPEDVGRLCRWVRESLGDDVPVHFTRFYPTYKLKNLPPTTVSAVEQARRIAMDEGLKFAYVGNVPAGHPGESTYCPRCGEVVVGRSGYRLLSLHLEDGRCDRCGEAIPGVWSPPA